MIELIVGAVVVVGVFVVLPLLLLKAFFAVAVGLVTLPFKLLGGLAKALGGLVGGLFGIASGLLGIVVGGVALIATVVLLPLLPLLILAGLVWLFVKATTSVAHA